MLAETLYVHSKAGDSLGGFSGPKDNWQWQGREEEVRGDGENETGKALVAKEEGKMDR